MKTSFSSVISFMLVILFSSLSFAADSFFNESSQQIDQRMQWWRHDRFGMFIHWGLYAVPAGQWNGNTNHAEWIRTTAQIPRDEYDKFQAKFNPVKFDADQWVMMAKNAGMKYIVITSKHHDGFCLWDSKVTNYDIIDGTPFKRDILKELTDACKKHGIRMCFYHSIMDWHHPDYLPRRDWEKWPADSADYEKYVSYMKSQLKEIITRYDPGVLWFDGEWENTWTHDRGLDLYDYVRSLKPDIIINNRVDKGRQGMQGMTLAGTFAGDFGTPEQEIPATGIPGVDWESCMTMNGHWGWNKNDKNFKSTTDLVRKLVDIASKGGNFLLNVGPKPDGTFPQESIDRLEQIGQWMKVNSDSIYGTTASPFKKLSWGRCTQKTSGQNTSLYLHVFSWPSNGKLLVPGLRNNIKKAYMLADTARITANASDDGVLLQIPKLPQNEIDSVIVLEISEPLKIEKTLPTQNINGIINLSAAEADIHNGSGAHAGLETKNDRENIGSWTNSGTTVEWKFKVTKASEFTVTADIALSSAGSQFNVIINDKPYKAKVTSTNSYENFQVQLLCRTGLLKPAEYSIKIIPDKDKWSPINIRSLKFKPEK